MSDVLPPRGEKWEHDFHYYIERARAAEHVGNTAQANSCALIALGFATAKIDWPSEK